MQEKIIGILALAALVVGFNFVTNFWQTTQVMDSLREIMNPNNQHTFKNRQGLEDAIYEAAYGIVGDDGVPEVEIYHFTGTTHLSDVDRDALPTYGGVKIVGEQVQMSALVCRIWWYQYTMWNKNWRKDVEITKVVFVDEQFVGSMYESPASADFEFVKEPWRLLDPAK
ncbi:MAG: hypothetical protein GY898_16545 [Proteobacteria bacterium]|nr:hypothetical protein [Pseudomonadota bacterium]